MQDLTLLFSYIETNEFFQIELLALLASLVLSLILSNSFPFFVASAGCFLANTGSLIYELSSGSLANFAYIEVTTTLTFAVLLLATFTHSLVKRSAIPVLRWHTVTTFGFCVFLAVRAFRILEDTARPIDLDVDRCSLEAAGFCAMHLLSALLMLQENSVPPLPLERNYDEKSSSMV